MSYDVHLQRIRDGKLAEGGNDLVRAALTAHLVRHGEEITNLRAADGDTAEVYGLKETSGFMATHIGGDPVWDLLVQAARAGTSSSSRSPDPRASWHLNRSSTSPTACVRRSSSSRTEPTCSAPSRTSPAGSDAGLATGVTRVDPPRCEGRQPTTVLRLVVVVHSSTSRSRRWSCTSRAHAADQEVVALTVMPMSAPSAFALSTRCRSRHHADPGTTVTT